jgi:hypothetical protein
MGYNHVGTTDASNVAIYILAIDCQTMCTTPDAGRSIWVKGGRMVDQEVGVTHVMMILLELVLGVTHGMMIITGTVRVIYKRG